MASYLRSDLQAGQVIFEVGSFCDILVGIPEMEKYSLFRMIDPKSHLTFLP